MLLYLKTNLMGGKRENKCCCLLNMENATFPGSNPELNQNDTVLVSFVFPLYFQFQLSENRKNAAAFHSLPLPLRFTTPEQKFEQQQ